MKASDALAEFFAAKHVSNCFELIGGMTTHIIDSLVARGDMEIVSMHHEQAAAFAAEGVSRATGGSQLGLAMATSGPGATNLLTGVASCWFDSIPCIFVTGQVNTNELRGSRAIRQQGFQELDVVAVSSPITKLSTQVASPRELLPTFHRAMSLSLSGRRGPVLIDVPNDIQRAEIPGSDVQEWLARPLTIARAVAPPRTKLHALRAMCESARRPLILLGGGSKVSPLAGPWLSQLSRARVPFVASLLGQERIPRQAGYFGLVGAYGNREANWAVQHCDFLLVIGSRLDIRQTGANAGDFARRARIAQVDIDEAQLSNRISVDLSIRADVDRFYRAFSLDPTPFSHIDRGWVPRLSLARRRSTTDEYLELPVSPWKLMAVIERVFRGRPVHFICDVGNHQMWAAHSLGLSPGQSLHQCGGLGAMGFGLPVGIGVAQLGLETVVISGDGGLQVNIQELDTLRRQRPNLILIVLNNKSLGMVKNFQDLYFGGRNQSTKDGYSAPSFAAVGAAYGVHAVAARTLRGAERAIRQAAEGHGPQIVEVIMEGATDCRPRLAFGTRLDEQHPRRAV